MKHPHILKFLALSASIASLVACSSDSSSNADAPSEAKEQSAEIKDSDYYKKNCPDGKTCTYVTTEQLNPSVTYGEFLDTRDYQVYKTIEICDDNKENCQTWMAQNLNYAYKGVKFEYYDGDKDKVYTSDSTSWCGGEMATQEESDCSVYGRLYTWAAAMDSAGVEDENGAGKGCGRGTTCNVTGTVRGVCPIGWHLPSDEELKTLYANVGGKDIAAKHLKANSSLWETFDGATNDDTYGFAAIPAGYRYYDGYFNFQGSRSYIWSSTEKTETGAFRAYLAHYNDNLDHYSHDKDLGSSVRCLKD